MAKKYAILQEPVLTYMNTSMAWSSHLCRFHVAYLVPKEVHAEYKLCRFKMCSPHPFSSKTHAENGSCPSQALVQISLIKSLYLK